MPFVYPRIEFRIDMRGLATVIRNAIGEVTQPSEMYEVLNTATNPRGEPYFDYVNYGSTGPRSAGGEAMVFMGPNGLVSRKSVAPMPAFHMRERALPLFKAYFRKRVLASKGQKANINTQREVGRYFQTDFFGERKQYIRLSGYKSNVTLSTASTRSAIFPEFWISIMEDSLDYFIAVMADLTPLIQQTNMEAGFTPERGLLKDSYEWRRLTGRRFVGLKIEKQAKRSLIGTSKKRATSTREKHLVGFTQRIKEYAAKRTGTTLRKSVMRYVDQVKNIFQSGRKKP